MKTFLSPRQAALSMGVSESSLKRWCDRGTLETQRTAGGHRKIPVSSVVRFLRENCRELVRPEIIGLPDCLHENSDSINEAIEPIIAALMSADREALHRIVFGFFLGGRTTAQICDELLTPALALIGDRWQQGNVEIFEEHRAVELIVRLLHQVRILIEFPTQATPNAIGGTVEGDAYGLPTQMIELALLEAGWNVTSLGTSLPFDSWLRAIRKAKPKLFWLSLSMISEHREFLDDLNRFNEDASKLTAVFVGGRGMTSDLRKQVRFATHCDNIQQLVARAKVLFAKSTTG